MATSTKMALRSTARAAPASIFVSPRYISVRRPILPTLLPARQSDPALHVPRASGPQSGVSKTDPAAPQVSPLRPAFTRRREAWIGRLAMFGWTAAYIGEILLHTGPIGQTQYILGWSREQVIALLVGTVVFNAIGALAPGSPTWSQANQQDVQKRPAGLNPIEQGFSKNNEINVGRGAMIGFAAAVIGEYFTGKGPLAQVAGYIGLNVDDGFYRAAGYGLLIYSIAITVLSYLGNNAGETETGKDIY